ncbi:putative leader peptide [Streptacidiphilus sp. N1-5]|uniref:Leader peptide n=1 Tax=Streptacidiphilus cavernicola TaxID=3342716 RepID=A0ABV6UMF9_9ACTN
MIPVQIRRFGSSSAPRPQGFRQLRVARRHVDLLRVSSALCPGTSPDC